MALYTRRMRGLDDSMPAVVVRGTGTVAILALVGAILLPASASAQQPPAGVAGLMKSVIIPQSDVVFGVGKTAPASDQEWTAVRDSAARLVEAGKALSQQAPGPGDATWAKFSKAMSDAAAAAGKAAQAKNVDAVLDAGDTLYESCVQCHKQYLKK